MPDFLIPFAWFGLPPPPPHTVGAFTPVPCSGSLLYPDAYFVLRRSQARPSDLFCPTEYEEKQCVPSRQKHLRAGLRYSLFSLPLPAGLQKLCVPDGAAGEDGAMGGRD